MTKTGLLGASAAFLGIIAAPAQAQQTAAAPAIAEPAGLGEIIVTAQRKSENLQKTAAAVTALSSELLTAKVTASENLGKLVPSVVIGAGGGGSNLIAIRGIGTLASNGLSENAIAFSVDGNYLARPAAANGIYFDLERVEVLKGPQGTLYGRNATAGAFNMITRRPTFEAGGYVDAQIGNYDMFQAQGAINLPLSETVAVRVAGQGINRNGYFSDGYNDQKQYAGRVSLLAKPSETVSVLLTADYSHAGGKGSVGVISPFVDPSRPYLGPSEPQANAPYTGFPFIPAGLLPIGRDGFLDNDIWGVYSVVDWDTGAGKLTIQPSYRRSDIRYRHYAGGFPTTVPNEVSNQTTLEARFATPDDNRLRALLGGYYFRETGSFSLVAIIAGPPTGAEVSRYVTRGLAAFGNLTFDLTETLRLVGGLRYSNEEKSVIGTANGGASINGQLSDGVVTWRAGVEADVAARSLLYATVSTGFKAGGFYSSSEPNTFKPEKLTAYTIGSKNRFVDNRLQINLEAYYWDYKDKQVTHLGPVRPAGFNLITENAGAATLYGAELETSFLITPNDLLSANLLYNRTKYDTFVYNQSTVTGPPVTSCRILPPSAGQAATTVNIDCSGNRLQQAPEWSANLSYTRTWELANDAKIVFGAASTIRSYYWLGDEQVRGQRQSGYITGDLDLTYRARDDRWSFGGFVQNVSDEAVKSQSFVQPVLGVPIVGLYAPRTYGIRSSVRF